MSPPADGLMLNSRGERRTKALEGTEVEQQTPSKWDWETRGNKLSWPPTLHELSMSSVALGDYPRWGGCPLINLIPCIIILYCANFRQLKYLFTFQWINITKLTLNLIAVLIKTILAIGK